MMIYMKKKSIILFFIMLYFYKADAQFQQYSFEQRNDAFVPLVNAEKILADTLWKSESYKNLEFSLGSSAFYFPFLGEKINKIAYRPSETPRGGTTIWLYGDSIQLYMILGDFLTRELSSQAPYQTKISCLIDSSNTAERFFKMEFYKLGVADSNGLNVGEINLQIWLSNKGKVEFHYGNCHAPSYAYVWKRKFHYNSGVLCWNFTSGQSSMHAIMTVGNPSNPNVDLVDGTNNFPIYNDSTLTSYPQNMVHSFFIKNPTGIETLNANNEINVFPNPVQSILSINTTASIKVIHIINLLGEELFRTNKSSIDCNSLKAGIYFIKVETDNGVLIKKFLKVE